jgi:D-aminopeptidase
MLVSTASTLPTTAGILFALLAFLPQAMGQNRARELGIAPGVISTGKKNAITDVAGIRVGHVTILQGDSVRTGVTAVIPHEGNLFQEKVPAAIFVGNGFGKLAGSTQVEELGNIEGPILLTNTLSVAEAIAGGIEYTISHAGNEQVRSVNIVVGETNDGYLNDIRGRHVTKADVLEAILSAKGGPVEEGTVGAGTGTTCFGYKGGIGTSSRHLPPRLGGYTIGVLVQTNYGGILQVNGAPVGRELGRYYLKETSKYSPDGSCMIVVATDAPADARNLKRLAARAMLGLAATGSSSSNGSGDYVIAFSTALECRVPANPSALVYSPPILVNEAMSPLFQAVKEATEEAVYNSLFTARTVTGYAGHTAEAIPVDKVLEICREHKVIRDTK